MIDDNALNALEYHKILAMLAGRAATSLGRAAALALLPATDADAARILLAETGEAAAVLTDAPPPFGGLSDITCLTKRASLGAVLGGRELSLIGQALYAMRKVKEFSAAWTDRFPHLARLTGRLTGRLTALSALENAIDTAISPEGEVKDEASDELRRLRRAVRTAEARVKEKLENILKNAQYQKYFQEQLVTLRGDRYVIPVRQEYRQFFPGVAADVSGSGATVFVEPLAAVELNNEIKNLRAEETKETERILRALSVRTGSAGETILANLGVLTRLDLLFAKGALARDMAAEPPELDRDGFINIIKGRHPLIPAAAVTPVDVRAGGEVKTLVITGANAGGKTVALKIIGLFALMAQAGLFLPAAAGTRLPVFDAVFTDIGDEQSIERNLSTFSGQITNLTGIVARAGINSLILLDEICAGTDPKEGAALAMAVLERLLAGGALTVVTTHYSELKVFALQTAGMENASVEFDQLSLRPTYRLLMGTPGSSNAFPIAARLGLSNEIVERARSLVDGGYRQLETVLSDLERERRRYEQETRELSALRAQAAELRDKLAEREVELREKKRDILEKSRAEAAETVRRARMEAQAAIREIKELWREQDDKARQSGLEGARRRLSLSFEPPEEDPPAGESLKPADARLGNWVYVPSLRQKGRILSVADGEVLLRIGPVKTSIALEKCMPSEEAPAKDGAAARGRTAGGAARAADFRPEIDVRGQTVEDAINILDKYIDDALLANARQVRVIHGKGTGALRRGLRDYFEKHPSVRAQELAALAEGGSGATVLFL